MTQQLIRKTTAPKQPEQFTIVPPKLTPLAQVPVCSVQDLEGFYYGLTETEMQSRMCNDHDSLIKQILEEEEEFITAHRQHIDQVVEVVKVDMQLLQAVDQPSSDIEAYIRDVDRVLLQKMEMISQVR